MTKPVKQGDEWFRDAVDRAVCDLVRREFYPFEASITLPIFYSNGDSVVVDVRPSGVGFVVSDSGATYQEVDSVGATSFFTRSARKWAEEVGVTYDAQMFSIQNVKAEGLSSAIAQVAECCRRSYDIAYEKLCAKKHEEDEQTLYNRLVKVFTEKRVVPSAKIKGASTHEWEVDALVMLDGGKALFEYVGTRNQGSYTPVAAKFHDIARLDNPPNRVSVVPSFEEMGDVVALLQQASTVIELRASDNNIVRAASAIAA